MGEDKKRSLLKSAIWRVMGMIILGLVTFFYTKNWIITGWVTFLHHFIFLWIFYAHERLHLRHNTIKNLTVKSIVKMFTYETLCGNIILGIISYLITGSIKQMGQITITYIALKHIIYIWNEFLWDRFKFWRS